jgi:hypothetical protein
LRARKEAFALEKRGDNFGGALIVVAILVVVGFVFAIRPGNDLMQLIGIIVMSVGVMSAIPLQLMISRE